ncbi:ATG C terminal domain-containing protein [Piptocephalis cylindrospora]|uniref:Autophagy-related protein 2 n=1 Tax=Piptocephalis cylindrospora TaxID=1907219 RepID=A0A4V1IYF3_9FUNG|nr:ATG C terminal domain-containing protein [Piptocephalis cylindrospora]|eukprot:RKP14359.1 ATG C terminal domain-containing protein [Piptocephalis cylindrospora]
MRDVQVLDRVPTSVWKKFMTRMRGVYEEEWMVRVKLESVRPYKENRKLEELRIRAKILPLRFHVDQDTLNFTLSFLLSAMAHREETDGPTISSRVQIEPEDESFIQLFDMKPLRLKVDYKPKRVDYRSLRHGQFLELVNIFQLDAAEMTLQGVRLSGVYGWARLARSLVEQWIPHVRDTQVPGLVGGVAPLRSLVNLGTGVADLILLPIEQYRKDGRVIRGLQKGAHSFVRATAMEALKLGTRLAVGTQVMLEQADDILRSDGGVRRGQGSRSSDPMGPGQEGDGVMVENRGDDGTNDSNEALSISSTSKFASPPSGLTEGLEQAYRSLSRNMGMAAHTIFAVPMEVYEQTGTSGTARAVVKAVPVAILRPMIGASEAFSKTLMGLRTSVDPSQRAEMEDKYK